MKIWSLKISTKYVSSNSSYLKFEQAKEKLYDYVLEYWDDGLTEQYGATEGLRENEAIDAYFDAWTFALDPEFYELESVERLGRP